MPIPKLVDGYAIQGLRLTPTEAFVLSLVDGRTALEELSEVAGVPVDEIRGLLFKLGMAGVIEWQEEQIAQPHRSDAARLGASSTPARGESRPPQAAKPPPVTLPAMTVPAPPSAPPSAAESEGVDLSPAEQSEISAAAARVEAAQTHYEVLGVPQNASKEIIREVYFKVSKRFHTDRYFGRRLGVHKSDMERVFRRLTEAYNVLGKGKARREYDEYLAVSGLAHAFEEALPSEPAPAPPQIPSRPAFREQDLSRPLPTSVPPPAPPVQRSTISDDERKRMARELLERRGAGSANRPASTAVERPASDERSRNDSAGALRDLAQSIRHASQVTGATDRAGRHVADAKAAEGRGDTLAAVNAMRLAASMAPTRTDYAAELERLRFKLAVEMADTQEKKARYEEEHGDFKAATLSWVKVADGRPREIHPLLAAMRTALHPGGDFRTGKLAGERAIKLEPKNVEAHFLLARVYVAAGMAANAKRAADEALRLDGTRQDVKAFLKDLR